MPRRKDFTGVSPCGGWTIEEFVRVNENGKAIWRCRCVCGKVEDRVATDIARGVVASCGCTTNRQKHGDAKRKKKTFEYGTWGSLKQKGLIVPEWQKFLGFLADMGRRPGKGYYLHRPDPSKPYGPGNAEWASRREPGKGVGTVVSFQGKAMNLSEWEEYIGVSHSTISQHMRRFKVTAEDAVKFYMKKYGE